MTNIHTEISGQGPALVMLHGWSMHSGIWRPFVRQLAEDFQVICLDLPGHGRSKNCQPYALDKIGDCLMKAIPTESFTVLGWSLGATLAIDLAHRYPERVEKLVMLAGNPCFIEQPDWPGVAPDVLKLFADNLQHSSQQTLLRFLALQVNGLPDGKRLLKQLKQAVQECPAPQLDALQGGLQLLQQSDLRNELQQLSQPVLAILAEQDSLIPLSCRLNLQQLKPETRIVTLEGAGHVPFLTHAESIQQALWHFIHA